MNNIYEEATRGYDVTETTAARVRGLIRDACNLEIHFSELGAFIEVEPQPPYGVCKVLDRFSSLLEAQNFAWAWLTGPYGVVRDVRFTKITADTCGIDLGVLIRGIRIYLEGKSTS